MPSILRVIAGRTQQRRVVEKKKGETIDVPEGSASQGLLITGCEDCVINAPGRLSCVTVERCNGGMRINLGNVVASLEVIYCTDVQFSVARYGNKLVLHAGRGQHVGLCTTCMQGSNDPRG